MFKPTLASSGAITIAANHQFADTTARDAYFAAHPTELVDKLYVYIASDDQLEQYYLETTSWMDITPVVSVVGETGATGATGAAGADGKTWYYGEGAPTSGLGVNGDFYLNTLTEWYYIKITGAWVEQTCLKGEGSEGVWGSITGVLAAQLDLQEALDNKVDNTITVNSYPLTSNVTIDVPDALSDLTSDSAHRVVTDTQINSWTAKQDALGYTPEDIANKGVANGYVPLGADIKIPSAYIGQISVTAVYPSPTAPESPTDGMVWVNTDFGTSYIYSEDTTTWYELGNSSGYVTTVNGHSGPSVTVTKTDLGLGNVVNVDSTVASNITSGTLYPTVLPIATTSIVGAVKAGTNILIDAEGAISVATTATLAFANITGEVSDNANLQDALDAKAAVAHNHDGTYQPVDLDLSAIAALEGTTGILTKTALNTWALETDEFATVGALTDGLATKSDTTHNHTGTYQLLDGDLTAIAALSGTGYLQRTGTNAWELNEGGGGSGGSFATYGTATIANGFASTSVTHGYGSVPTVFEVLPDCTISDVSATGFVITVDTAVSEDTTFSWVIWGATDDAIGGGTFS